MLPWRTCVQIRDHARSSKFQNQINNKNTGNGISKDDQDHTQNDSNEDVDTEKEGVDKNNSLFRRGTYTAEEKEQIRKALAIYKNEKDKYVKISQYVITRSPKQINDYLYHNKLLKGEEATIQSRESIAAVAAEEDEMEEDIILENPQDRYDPTIKTSQYSTSRWEAAKSRAATDSGQVRNNGISASDTGATDSDIERRRDNSESTVMKIVNCEDGIGKELIDEIKRRSQVESVVDVSRNCQNGKIGVMESIENGICHICKKRQRLCYAFACSQKYHMYCQKHMNVSSGLHLQYWKCLLRNG